MAKNLGWRVAMVAVLIVMALILYGIVAWLENRSLSWQEWRRV